MANGNGDTPGNGNGNGNGSGGGNGGGSSSPLENLSAAALFAVGGTVRQTPQVSVTGGITFRSAATRSTAGPPPPAGLDNLSSPARFAVGGSVVVAGTAAVTGGITFQASASTGDAPPPPPDEGPGTVDPVGAVGGTGAGGGTGMIPHVPLLPQDASSRRAFEVLRSAMPGGGGVSVQGQHTPAPLQISVMYFDAALRAEAHPTLEGAAVVSLGPSANIGALSGSVMLDALAGPALYGTLSASVTVTGINNLVQGSPLSLYMRLAGSTLTFAKPPFDGPRLVFGPAAACAVSFVRFGDTVVVMGDVWQDDD